MILWGVRRYGRVDVLDEGHVATRFLHFFFVPCVPLGTVFVAADGDSTSPLPFSVKSLFAAWLRTGLVVVTLGALAGLGGVVVDAVDAGSLATAVRGAMEYYPEAIVLSLLWCLAVAPVWLAQSWLLSRVSPSRRRELAQRNA